MRKILSLLFSVTFLLVFISFFSQKSLATEYGGDCTSFGNGIKACSDVMKGDILTCVDGKWATTYSCRYGCDDTTATCTTTPSDPTAPQSPGSIPAGQSGCSFTMDSKATPIIACQNGGICAPIGGKVNTSVTPNTYENGFCVDTQNKCPLCGTGYQPDFNTGKCSSISDSHATEVPFSTIISCAPDEGCTPGVGCSNGSPDQTPPLSLCNGTCDTALGPLPTDIPGLLTKVFSIALAIAGVLALGLIIASGYRLMMSQGNPEQVKGAREQLTAAIVGLLFIIFSLVILQIIGANILGIPGFGK